MITSNSQQQHNWTIYDDRLTYIHYCCAFQLFFHSINLYAVIDTHTHTRAYLNRRRLHHCVFCVCVCVCVCVRVRRTIFHLTCIYFPLFQINIHTCTYMHTYTLIHACKKIVKGKFIKIMRMSSASAFTAPASVYHNTMTHFPTFAYLFVSI